MGEDLYITLIYKRLTEEITESESKQLDDWLLASEDNKTTAKNIEIAWKETADLRPNISVNLDQEFQALQKRIQQDGGKQTENPKVRKLSRVWYAAASIVLLLTVGYLMRGQLFNSNETWLEASTGNEQKELTLADGTTVTLNKNSYIKYPETFNGKKRVVEMRGEVFFDVFRNPKQPFQVINEHTEINVLGTSFNVKEDPNSKHVTVHVASGKVQFKSVDNDAKALELTKGQQAVYHWEKEHIEQTTAYTSNDLAWRTKKLHYAETPVLQAMPQIEKLYGITIEVENPEVKQCTISGLFDNYTLEETFQYISEIYNVEIVEVKPNHYLLKGGYCE